MKNSAFELLEYTLQGQKQHFKEAVTHGHGQIKINLRVPVMA
jgi:hypothetical protein